MSKRYYNTGIIMDTHHPFVDRKAYNLMLQVFDDFNVDEIVIIGDFGDFYFCNAHGKDPEISQTWSPKREIAYVRTELEKLRTRYPAAHIVYIQGNHEYRLNRYIQKQAPDLFGLVDWMELLDPTRKVVSEFIAYGPRQMYKLARGSSLLGARHEPLGGGDFPALNTVKKSNCSLVFGHTHVDQRAQVCMFDGTQHVAATFGHLADSSHAAFSYVKAHHQWAQGFGTCVTDLKTGQFWLEGHQIINNSTKANGTLYFG